MRGLQPRETRLQCAFPSLLVLLVCEPSSELGQVSIDSPLFRNFRRSPFQVAGCFCVLGLPQPEDAKFAGNCGRDAEWLCRAL